MSISYAHISLTYIYAALKLQENKPGLMKKVMWRQKAKIQQLKEEDNNTKFFHKMAKCRQSINGISRLKVGEVWVEREKDIRFHTKAYFHNRYAEDWDAYPKVEGIQFPSISKEHVACLERWCD